MRDHFISGILIVLINVVSSAIALVKYNSVVLDYFHAYCGIVYLALPIMAAGAGTFLKIYRFSKNRLQCELSK